MRLTASILALLIIVLSCLPCADGAAISLPNTKKETSKSSQGQHQQHHEKDMCSPFCHCSCCSTYSVVNIPLVIDIIIQQTPCANYVSEVSDAVIEISLPVWQPPQLV